MLKKLSPLQISQDKQYVNHALRGLVPMLPKAHLRRTEPRITKQKKKKKRKQGEAAKQKQQLNPHSMRSKIPQADGDGCLLCRRLPAVKTMCPGSRPGTRG